MSLRTNVVRLARAVDRAASGHRLPKRVLIEVRTPMNLVVLDPICSALGADDRVALTFTAEDAPQVRPLLDGRGLGGHLRSGAQVRWRRFDLALSADPWNPAVLHRCQRRVNVFHGVAGKYDLDAPTKLPVDFRIYDRVLFPNEDRLQRYVEQQVIRPEQAVLTGFPKIDPLVNQTLNRAAILASLGLTAARPTVLYAPTFSPASSLHLAGEAIVSTLLDAGYNVVVKLHDRSMVPTARYTAGIDWPSHFTRFASEPRFVFARGADVAPLLCAADLLITDHSTVGFEFALLDRPLLVFDAPDLKTAARIDDGKWTLLRSMSDVIHSAPELPNAVARALSGPERLRTARHQAWSLFAHAGTATARSLDVIYDLLALMPPLAIRSTAAVTSTQIIAGGPEGPPLRGSVRRSFSEGGRSAPARISPVVTNAPMTFSVVIATYNRADDLRATLTNLSGQRTSASWEVIVVDNNSSDHTPSVVQALACAYPVPLRYLFEPTPGRSAALNTGIRSASGSIVVTTDDDVRVEPDWLDQAGAALDRLGCGYIGGRVLPIWGGPRPAWLPDHPSPHWAVIALLDYGPAPIELTRRMPLGVNMAFRREVFDIVGGWDPRVGRKAGTLLGQEVREWCIRARAKGVRGYYAPEVAVRHIIPAGRLNKAYYRRWFYWRGISRALLYQQQGLDMESPQETTTDFSTARHIAGIPRYLFRTLCTTAAAMMMAALRGRREAAFERELWIWMFAGIARQRWRDRRTHFAWSGPREGDPVATDAPLRSSAGSPG